MKVATSVILARRKSLAELLESHHYLPLAEVCSRLGISEATARRDLRLLASEKKITRTYGGALGSFDVNFDSFADRRVLAHAIKARLARKARAFIRPGTTCFFDGGTTVFAVAEALYRDPVPNLKIVTNSLPVAEILGRCREMEVNLLGGRFLQRQSLLLGPSAQRSVQQWKFDLVFLGAEGLSRDGIWASENSVATFQKTLLKQTRKVILCAHDLKAGRETGVFLSPWTSKFQLVTNVSPARLKKLGLPSAL